MGETKHPEAPILILLGGGIGSGKSIALRRFEQLGAMVVEADRLGHAVLEPDGEAFAAVSERWPSVVIGHQIDRSALAEIVFGDPALLIELEAMTHPPIIRRIRGLAAGGVDLVVEIPLILDVPGDWTRVFVDTDEDLRVHRAVDRGASEADVRRRLANQPDRAEWVSWADETIGNNGSLDELEALIDALWQGLRT